MKRSAPYLSDHAVERELTAAHLTEDTAEGLLAAAAHKTKLEIEQLLAQRFPRPDLPPVWCRSRRAPAPFPPSHRLRRDPVGATNCPRGQLVALQNARRLTNCPQGQSRPLGSRTRHESNCPRGHRPTRSPRHIPAAIMRAVWARDEGQCTFVSDSARRCEARTFIAFDHVLEVARGGEASVDGLRLRCRGHNQYQAERTFGAEFMRHKRRAAAEA